MLQNWSPFHTNSLLPNAKLKAAQVQMGCHNQTTPICLCSGTDRVKGESAGLSDYRRSERAQQMGKQAGGLFMRKAGVSPSAHTMCRLKRQRWDTLFTMCRIYSAEKSLAYLSATLDIFIRWRSSWVFRNKIWKRRWQESAFVYAGAVIEQQTKLHSLNF